MKKCAFIIITLLLLALPVTAQTVDNDASDLALVVTESGSIETDVIGALTFISGYGMLVSFLIFIISIYFTVSLAKKKQQYLKQHPDVRSGEIGETDLIKKSRRHASILSFFVSLLLVSLIPSGPIFEGLFKNGNIGFVVVGVLIVLFAVARILYAVRIRNFIALARTGHAEEHGELYRIIFRHTLWKRAKLTSITTFLLMLEVWAVVVLIT